MINGKVIGNDIELEGMNEIHRVSAGDLIFVDHPKYFDKALQSEATGILINEEVEPPKGKVLILCDEPFTAFNRLLYFFEPFELSNDNISPKASIGKDCSIHPSAYIAPDVSIGDNCIVHPNVCIYSNVRIGNNVVIQANTVIGSHGFYYKKRAEYHERLHSAGSVVIGDHVEIGALCSIDKGVTSATSIGSGTVIDNQVHIGHDTIIGSMCLFAAQVGIAGCVTIGNNVTLWGQVGVPSDITIGDGAVLLGQSAPSKSLEGGKVYLGSPAGEARMKMRELSLIKKIPEIMEKLK